jgi:hypothetical protein
MSRKRQTRIEIAGSVDQLLVQKITRKAFERYISSGIPQYEHDAIRFQRFREKFNDCSWFCGVAMNSNLQLRLDNIEVANAYEILSDEVMHTFHPIERLERNNHYLVECLYSQEGVLMTEIAEKFDFRNLGLHIKRYEVLEHEHYSIVSATYNEKTMDFLKGSPAHCQHMFLLHDNCIKRLPAPNRTEIGLTRPQIASEKPSRDSRVSQQLQPRRESVPGFRFDTPEVVRNP